MVGSASISPQVVVLGFDVIEPVDFPVDGCGGLVDFVGTFPRWPGDVHRPFGKRVLHTPRADTDTPPGYRGRS